LTRFFGAPGLGAAFVLYVFLPYHRRMRDPAARRPVEPAVFEQPVAHALQFDGRKAFGRGDNMMAAIAAAHVADCLRRGGN
jgi:hypothetical protein